MDPFLSLRQEIDQVFDNMLGDWTGRSLFNSGLQNFIPTVDVKETSKEIRVTAELPGLEQKDIQVSLLEGMLTIKGEKREEHEEEKGETYRCERQYGAFERTIALPAGVDADLARGRTLTPRTSAVAQSVT
ncbi:MAG TPA: Hsp20/alpha crystallin family protein [Chthoniobacterales bacterium]|nr:Hsp20/alpha crystallin family protein [Chthoniobacterales bacterium]